jgi:transposase
VRPLRRLGATRRQLLEELDRPFLRPLPAEPYVFAEWRARRVGVDYHVDVDGHFYSVPYRFARQQIEVRLTARTVEIFSKGERIAAHLRSSGNGKYDRAGPCRPVTGAMPTGPSTGSAARRPLLARPWRSCAT